MPGSFLRFWLPFWRTVASVLLFLLGPIKIRGAYRVRKEGGVLILANHLSDIDPVIVQYACPRHIRFMAKHELFDMPSVGKWIRFFGGFPVKRGEPDRQALKRAVALLKSGQAVGVFPEGQISEDGELQELKAGIALIARLAEVPVICCTLEGTQRIMPYAKVWPRPSFGGVRATWGEEKKFSKDVSTEEFLAWAASQLKTD